MIVSPTRRRTDLLLLALVLSVVLHLAGGEMWALLARAFAHVIPRPLFMASLRETPAPRAEVIRLERRPVAAAAPLHEHRAPKVAPRPRPVVTLAPALPLPKHELARIRPHAAPQAPPAPPRAVAYVRPPRVRPPAPTAVHAPVKPALSDRRIAQLGEQFAKTIAASHETLADVQAESERAHVTTVKQYTTSFAGFHEGMKPGDGEIFALSKQRIGNTVWYYTRYTYLHSDGTYEADDIPWPFHYPVGDDPFARGDHRIPLQPPPAGFHPDRPLKPILAQFFGGPPVTD